MATSMAMDRSIVSIGSPMRKSWSLKACGSMENVSKKDGTVVESVEHHPPAPTVVDSFLHSILIPVTNL